MAAKEKGFWTETRTKRLVKLRATNLSWADIGAKFGVSGESARQRYIVKKRELRQEDHPLAEYTPENIGEIVKNRRHKDGMFFVTSAQPVMPEASPDTAWNVESNLHKGFLKTIKGFCKLNDAELIILPTSAHMKALRDTPTYFDEELIPLIDTNFSTSYKFNKYLRAFDAKINPQQQNPLNGLGNIGTSEERTSSIIVASPKQLQEVAPTGKGDGRKLLASTGSITLPQYRNNRMGRIAAARHVVGGLIVTVIGSKFIIHQVQCTNDNGDFNYMARRYSPDGTSKFEAAEGFLAGDLHLGMEDPIAMTATHEQLATLSPKRVFVSDVLEGASVSHHIEKDLIQRSTLPEEFSTLDKELDMCTKRLEDFWSYCPEGSELYMVDSNHNTFLHRYLRSGRYMKDPQNFGTAVEMVSQMRKGLDPLQLRLDPDSLYTWLGSDDDLLVEGVQMAIHSDSGANGARGNIKGIEKVSGNAMIGHSHTPNIHYGTFQVGTLSKLRMGYNSGISSWMHCNGVVYKGGQKSLLTIIDGEWL